MHTLAIVYIVLCAAMMLPGSAYVSKPRIDWESAHVYMAITASACGILLAILTLV